MLVYSKQTIAAGNIWVKLANGTEVYGNITITEKHAFNDENDVKQLFAKCDGKGYEYPITNWGWN